MLLNSLKVMTRRSQTMFPDQRNQLLCSDKKSDRINKPKQPQNDESGEPIRIAAREKPSEEFFIRHHERDGGLLKTDAFEDRGKTRIGAHLIPSRIDLQPAKS